MKYFKFIVGFVIVGFVVLFILAILIRRRVHHALQSLEQRMETPNWRMGRMAVAMLRRSFLLIWAAVLLLLYDLLKLPHVNFSVGRFLNQMVFVLLFTRWGTDFIRHRFEGAATGASAFAKRRWIHFFQLFRVLAICHLLFTGLLSSESLIVWLARLVLESGLFIWMLSFWRGVQQQLPTPVHTDENAPAGARLHLAKGGSYLVAGGALLMELAGYDAMAGHWLVAWAKTILVALWAGLGWTSINEWYAGQRTGAQPEAAPTIPQVAAPIGWFLVQMTRLFWLAAVLSGILMVWSSATFTTTVLRQIFDLHFAVGSLNVSVKGILLAVVILCLTHMATRMGRRILTEKVLDAGRFERDGAIVQLSFRHVVYHMDIAVLGS